MAEGPAGSGSGGVLLGRHSSRRPTWGSSSSGSSSSWPPLIPADALAGGSAGSNAGPGGAGPGSAQAGQTPVSWRLPDVLDMHADPHYPLLRRAQRLSYSLASALLGVSHES